MKKAILMGLPIMSICLILSCGKDDGPTPDPEPQEVEITSFSPTSGTVGTEVTINGKNFSSAKEENNVTFGSFKAPVVEASPTKLVVQVPTNAVTGKITVTVGSSSATSTTNFEVLVSSGPPTVTNFEPKFGVPGTEVIIYGENFSTQANAITVTFGDADAIPTNVVNGQITLKVPEGATTGSLSIVTMGAPTVTTADDFTVYVPSSMTMTPDAGYVEEPAFEIGEEISLFFNADVPSGISEFLVHKIINGGEPALLGDITFYHGYVTLNNIQLLPEVEEAIGNEVEIIFSLKGEADIDYATASFSYTVAEQGQGGYGGKYPTFSIIANVKLGSQGNMEYGSYYNSSANAVYSNPGGLTDSEQQLVDITFGTSETYPNLISPDERANYGLNNPLGDNAAKTWLIFNGPASNFNEITSYDVGAAYVTEYWHQGVSIEENMLYKFQNASGEKGVIKVNSITGDGDNKVVHFDIIVQD
ncbi:hypothetical protein F8C76_03835 [Flagellimonas olearia]|uniref:IPT/TIG domain-containing protein n=1 Tax=Flagellimonas olearia TaxID=552546 RepID=A0A6I1E2B7_9FLAO|nr:IPT/TIG domain-containing protein [Allomuricauda olearia]KAB7530639.1 hypothetical protein F8C76_03835 [Allomuricauda olearia]